MTMAIRIASPVSEPATTFERWAVIGAGCAFAQEAILHLGELGPERIGGIGRSWLPANDGPFDRGLRSIRGFSYHTAHVTYDFDRIMQLMDMIRPEVIVNFAAQGESAASWTESWRYFETNCVGLARLVETLSTRGYLRRFIQISSGEVYGSVGAPVDEDAPTRPTSPYAASKAAFDAYLGTLHRRTGFPAIIIRPVNTYCVGQQLHRIIPKAIVSGLRSLKVPLNGGGANRKSYVHARDLARAIVAAAERGEPGAIYNVGSSEPPISIRDLVARCAEALGIDSADLGTPVDRPADRPGQDACYWLDARKIADEMGFEPTVDLDEGIAEVVAWARQHHEALRLPTGPYMVRP